MASQKLSMKISPLRNDVLSQPPSYRKGWEVSSSGSISMNKYLHWTSTFQINLQSFFSSQDEVSSQFSCPLSHWSRNTLVGLWIYRSLWSRVLTNASMNVWLKIMLMTKFLFLWNEISPKQMFKMWYSFYFYMKIYFFIPCKFPHKKLLKHLTKILKLQNLALSDI